jgi:ParB family chromosome partitioning protein
MTDKTRRLGRGLDALLSPAAPSGNELRFPNRGTVGTGPGFQVVSLASITPNRLQPRKDFDESALAELRSSINTNGLLQPLLVRPSVTGYELVAGERRLRAVQSLGWKDVPVHIRELDDQAVLTLALIENLQRSDLNPIEEAEGYQELIARFSLTQQQVAAAVGRERATVANMIRLLGLPDGVRRLVRSGELSIGHARALLGLSGAAQMLELVTEVIRDGLTVRDVERRVRESGDQKAKRRTAKPPIVARPPEASVIETELRRKLQTDVAVSVGPAGKGELRISFYSSDDLERLLDLLLGPGREQL